MDEQTAKALKKIQEEGRVEEKQEAQPKQQEQKKQPQPDIMNYGDMYKLSDLFIEHLKKSLSSLPHYRAYQYIKFAEDHKEGISIVDLNGFIKKLDMIEYGYVNGLMTNIKRPEGQRAYFLPLKTNDGGDVE